MREKTDSNSFGAALLDRDDGLQADRRGLPELRHGGGRQAFRARAGAFVVGMAIHNESLAQRQPPRPAPIYYCATGEEIPLHEPCKERKDQGDI